MLTLYEVIRNCSKKEKTPQHFSTVNLCPGTISRKVDRAMVCEESCTSTEELRRVWADRIVVFEVLIGPTLIRHGAEVGRRNLWSLGPSTLKRR